MYDRPLAALAMPIRVPTCNATRCDLVLFCVAILPGCARSFMQAVEIGRAHAYAHALQEFEKLALVIDQVFEIAQQ